MAIPQVSISSVRFDLSTSADNAADARVFINSPDLTKNGQPHTGGVDDLHLGTNDSKFQCLTCRRGKQQCLGHEGAIRLKYPVFTPLAISDVPKWLKVICHNCGSLIVPVTGVSPVDILKNYISTSRTTIRKCPACSTVQPIVAPDRSDPTRIYIGASKQLLYPHVAKEIFSRVRPEDVAALGRKVHPSAYILDVIRVSPVTTRPAVRKISGDRVTNDDTTTLLQIIVKRNETLPGTIPEKIDSDFEKAIYHLNKYVYEFTRGGTGEAAPKSNAASFKGKQGIPRGNLLGKRVMRVSRSTIVGDYNIAPNELGIPLSFAKTIVVEEIVQNHNKDRLLQYIRNGKEVYPGATAIVKARTGARYDVDKVNISDIDNGDKVLRNVIDGDYGLFNRQPTLMISNMSAHRVIVMKDPNSFPIRMNVCATPLYNADFDGDAMNLIFFSDEAARVELRMLSSVNNWFISYENSSPPMGQVDDGIIGNTELTRDDVRINKYHAMQLFESCNYAPDFTQDEYTGREIVSLLLSQTPINVRKTAKMYAENMVSYINYSKTETDVVIRNGVLESGVLDKVTIGKKAGGGVYHIIANEYGAETAIRVMHDMQRIAIAFLSQRGYTIGLKDIVLDDKAYDEINAIGSGILEDAELLNERLLNGDIVPSFGETTGSMYENQMIQILKILDEFTRPIMNCIDPRNNSLYNLIAAGSKGTMNNMFNMMSSVGQKQLDGKRMPKKFGHERTSAYSRRFSLAPIDNGYISNSLTLGMNSQEYIASAYASRLDLTIKALSTSVTGEMSRKSIMCLNANTADNHMRVLNDNFVIELVFGDNYADSRYIENVKFGTIMINDVEFKEKYFHKDFPDYFATMEEDRKKYRAAFMTLENLLSSVENKMSGALKMSFNLERILVNVLSLRKGARKPLTAKELKAAMTALNTAINNIPYVFLNEIQERKQAAVLPHIQAAAWLPQMLIRSILHPNALITNAIDVTTIGQIFTAVRLKMTHSLITPGTSVGIIAAQSYSEPLVQYMLDAHHRSASGGSSFAGIDVVTSVLGARPTEKMANPSMFVRVKAEYEHDEHKVQEIANSIGTVIMREFVSRYQVFFESFKKPIHPAYKLEADMIDAFVHANPLLQPPSDLINFCVRFVINRSMLVLKSMPLETLIERMRTAYPDAYLVYTPENSPNVIIRVYMRNSMVSGIPTVSSMEALVAKFLDTPIRGIRNIVAARMRKIVRSKVGEDGGIINDSVYAIETQGTNLIGVMSHPCVNASKTYTNSIAEMEQVLGIVAARQQIIVILHEIVACNWCNLMIYADEMTSTGTVTGISSSGMKARSPWNIYARMGFSSPQAKLVEAGIYNVKSPIVGAIPSLMVGMVPKLGTKYNEYMIDDEFVAKNVKSPDNIIDDIFA